MIIQLILTVFLTVLLIFTTYLGEYRNTKLPSYYIMVLKFWVPLTDKYWIK